MSESSEIDSSNHPGCDSDREFSVPSSHGPEMQDCSKRPQQPELIIQGNSWVSRAQITVDQLNANSDWLTTGFEGDVENDERTAKINAHTQSLFGAQIHILFGNHRENVLYMLFSAT